MVFRKGFFPKLMLLIFVVGLLFPPLITLHILERTFTLRITEIGVLVGIVFILTQGYFHFRLFAFYFPAISFLLWIIASSFWSQDMLRTIMSSFYIFESYLVFLLSYHFIQKSPQKTLLTVIRTFEIILVVQMLYAISKGVSIVGWRLYPLKDYIKTPLGGSNFIALFLEFTAIFELTLKEKKWPFFASVAVSGIIITLSRGGIISLGIGLGILFVFDMLYRKKIALSRLGLIGGTIGLILFLLQRMEGDLFTWFRYLGYSLNNRMNLLKDGLEALAYSPLLGIGFGAFGVWAGTYQRSPHNLWVQLLSETGVIGTGIFLILLVTVGIELYKGFKNPRVSTVYTATIFGLLVLMIHSMGEPFFLDTSSSIWVGAILGMLLGYTSSLSRRGLDIRGKQICE